MKTIQHMKNALLAGKTKNLIFKRYFRSNTMCILFSDGKTKAKSNRYAKIIKKYK